MTPDQKLDKILDEVQQANVTLAGYDIMIHGHEKTLYGNGQPGLEKTVTLIGERQKNCKASANQSRQNVLMAVSIIVCVVSVVTLFLSITRKDKEPDLHHTEPKVSQVNLGNMENI